MEKASVFTKIWVLFWPEIFALGVFLNFDNERMRPPKYQSAPPPPGLFAKDKHARTYYRQWSLTTGLSRISLNMAEHVTIIKIPNSNKNGTLAYHPP